MDKIAYLILLIVSGTTLIGSILGAVFQLDFGWWLLTVLGTVVIAAAAIFLSVRLSERE